MTVTHSALAGLAALALGAASVSPAHSLDTRLDVAVPDSFLISAPNAPELSALDRAEIQELKSHFNWYVDTRRFDALGTLFTDDATLDHQWGVRKGRAAIVDLIRTNELHEKGARHQSTNAVVTSHGPGQARMVAYLLVLRTGKETGETTPYVLAHGVQFLDLERQNGRWRIARLVLDQTLVHKADVPDERDRDAIVATAATRSGRSQ